MCGNYRKKQKVMIDLTNEKNKSQEEKKINN